MDGTAELSRAARRLLSEMVDDGVTLDADGDLLGVVLDELEYARRPQQFERRTPVYGSMIVPSDRSLISAGDLVDLVPLDDRSLDEIRRFADGRAAFLAIQPGGSQALATFRRSVQYEADLVEVQADTGAFIVQRTPVLGVTRLFTVTATIEWSGYRWSSRPNARAQHELLKPWLPRIAPPVLRGMLELAVHWLSPARVGATLVVPVSHGESGLDLEHSIAVPGLYVTARHHYPSLLSALMQTDLATVVDADGEAHHIGVGLHWSAEAEATVETSRGMRHRSAARYTFDHPEAVAVVVSEDGPITVFHHGKALSECAASLALAAATNGTAA
jgi:DisA bacterial checkpoint controller nucleotide-binding